MSNAQLLYTYQPMGKVENDSTVIQVLKETVPPWKLSAAVVGLTRKHVTLTNRRLFSFRLIG